MDGALTSLVLPVHNQADHIERAVGSFLDVLERLTPRAEVVLVPNGSTDGTEEACRRLAERDGRVRVVELAEGGWGRAVRHGLRAAEGDVLAYTNSARTSTEILTVMLAYANAYPSVVLKANRRIRESRRRRLGSLLYNLECRALFDLPTWDINGTPKIFPRSFHRLLELSRDDDLIDAEFSWICRREGYPVVEVPVLATERRGGRSTTSYRSALRMYRGALELRRRVGAVDGASG